ncbi:MAG: bifunctional hydroxymethylpyrimidine kinase/phosphomethylpyrimidine kinase [Hyphomonadaceae bacterium]|nr:bifunctional hydroxymethylpyrimidine kinase/phosphomethylpyrimidine kinase [Hyphomonadaceae bacterium]
MKTVLTISSQVAGALVGNSVAVQAYQRLGVGVIALPTTLLGIRPDRGAPGGGPIAPETLRSMIEALEADGRLRGIDAVVSGYLALPEHAALILDVVDRVKAASPAAVYVCDPVMGDGAPYVKPDIAQAICETLAPRADWLAPNAWEMSQIAGKPETDLDAMRAAARRFGKPALISSIPTAAGLGVLYAAQSGDWICETQRLPVAPKGTGDLLTALFVARRVRGEGAAVSLEASVGAVHDVIVRSIAAELDDLALPEAHDLLEEPETWPSAQALGR